MIGVTNIDSILIERTLFELEAEQVARANAKIEAERLALEFCTRVKWSVVERCRL
ncbi:hypothetical protein [Ancylobacter moscoviensis]|uniref:hypothetical protein n=1 Tax=Ancylobacter moscoviensis TaxID=2597768 RepID=UPI00164241BC|nr:hypothetical protein [Ancylobacter moscoviensis]